MGGQWTHPLHLPSRCRTAAGPTPDSTRVYLWRGAVHLRGGECRETGR